MKKIFFHIPGVTKRSIRIETNDTQIEDYLYLIFGQYIFYEEVNSHSYCINIEHIEHGYIVTCQNHKRFFRFRFLFVFHLSKDKFDGQYPIHQQSHAKSCGGGDNQRNNFPRFPR